MKRQLALLVFGGCLLAIGAGCTTTDFSVGGADPRGEVDDRDVYLEPQSVRGGATLIKPSDIHENGQGKDASPVITEPTFVSIEEAEAEDYLYDELYGVSVFDGETPKFYPFQILAWHEVVEDTVNGEAVSVTYSILTDTALVTKGHGYSMSGLVWNSSTLFYDAETQSLWSQPLERAVFGERAGEAWETVTFDVLPWGAWKERYANGQVLSSETGVARRYEVHPLGGYLENPLVPFPRAVEGLRVQPPKQLGFGVEAGDAAKMYYKRTIEDRHDGVKNDQLGDLDLVVWVDANEVVRAHPRGTHTFTGVWADGLVEGRTRWTLDREGNLTSGDETLEALPVMRTFWFLWASLHPETELFGYLVSGPLVDGPVEENEDIDYETEPDSLTVEPEGDAQLDGDLQIEINPQ